jgi:sugar lactone lactonase YvrE
MMRVLGLAIVIIVSLCACVVGQDRLELLAGGSIAKVGIPAKETQLLEPFAAEYDEFDRLWIVEMARGNRLLRVGSDGLLEHIAGRVGPRRAGEEETLVEGAADRATFHGPHNLAIFNSREILIGDTWNGRIRRWTEGTDEVDSLAGYAVDMDRARSEGPYCITLSPDKKTLYLANLQQVYARDMDSGEMRVVAGNGKKGVPKDGTEAIQAPLVDPRAVAADNVGNLYILERGGNALRVVDALGMIRTVVNRSGKKGTGLEEGNALDIGLNGPKHLCIDPDGAVLIADAESHTIRRYDPKTGTLTRVAGTGKSGKGDVSLPPRECMLSRPHGVSIQPSTGKIVITDSYNDRVLLLNEQ